MSASRRQQGCGVKPSALAPVFLVFVLLGSRAANNASRWDNHLDPVLQPFLADHVVEGSVVFPASGFVEMALAASTLVNGGDSHEIFDLEIRRPLLLDSDVSKSVRFALNAEDGAFQIESRQRLSDDPSNSRY